MAGKYLHLYVFVMCAIQTNTGFNIDLQFPVIKEGKTKGSLFGFSVALHKQTEKTKKNFLLVGAPQEKAQPQLSKFNINETGAVYYCPITIEQDDCRRMDIIKSHDQNEERRETLWRGHSNQNSCCSSLLSCWQACGHRYVKKLLGAEEQQRMVGKCYVRGNDLTYTHFFFFSYGGMTENDVYFGTPGSFVWQGEYEKTNKIWYAHEISFGKLGEDRLNIYIGYSVLEDIKLLDRSKYTVVTGAPRDNFKGSVILAEKQGLLLNPVMTIPGEQIGSYFGGCLAVTDLNNDDWNDLIVGAPFYFDRNKEEGGAVYIFMNENGSFQEKASLLLKGKKGSGFGFAVAAVGDVNQDGFQDLAVGAPFQDSGKVFIWMGSKNGITTEPSQVIEGKSLGPSGFQTFGYSLSGGLDMDGNDYPDILVGSMDDRIALLRARPVIHLSQNFTVEPKIVSPNQCVNSCIKVKVCFSYNLSTGNTAFKKDITVKYTVDSDPNRRVARVRFLDNKQSTFTGLLSFSAPACQELELSVNTPVRDKLQPIVFTLNVSLNEQKAAAPQTLQSLDAFPVLSGQQILTNKTEINFHKECGVDNMCSSNLQLEAKFADENYIPFPSSIKKLVMMVDVTNMPDGGRQEAEDAHQAMLSITIPPSLKYSGVRTLVSPHGGALSLFSSPPQAASLRKEKSQRRVHMQGEPLGDLGTLMIDFEWPYEVANGKWLLYLTEIVIKGASESRCVPPGKVVNPLKLTLSDRGTKRFFIIRMAFVSVQECSKRTARCVTFSCPLHNMSSQAEIRVRSRVWNSTLLEDYANALRVEVKGQATLRLLKDKPAIRMANKTREFLVNIDPVLGEETPYEVPLWIIIVSAVAGILLLGIISLILWKCGFFRRASRREMYEAKSQKAEIKIQPSETERLTEEF
uniref:Integrin alpha-3-like n=1 Tax=Sinocyclocheilus rhinocerous TaxID=307959 RepID=A0A673G1V5_9TELE